MDEELEKMGKTVYETICAMLDEKGYRYQRHDDEYYVSCGLIGEDLPMDMILAVHPERQIVRLISPIPFTVPEDKRVDIALATTVVNDRIVDGSFDFDLSKGRICFRCTASYIESILGKELFSYMLHISASTVDEYNDKFLMICKGIVSFEDFANGLDS